MHTKSNESVWGLEKSGYLLITLGSLFAFSCAKGSYVEFDVDDGTVVYDIHSVTSLTGKNAKD